MINKEFQVDAFVLSIMQIGYPAIDCKRDGDSGNHQDQLSYEEAQPTIQQAVCQSPE